MILIVLIKYLEIPEDDCKSHWIQKLAFLFGVEEKGVELERIASILSFIYSTNVYGPTMICWEECYVLGI